MFRSPAGTPGRSTTARGAPGPPGVHTVAAVQLVGHAGLAIQSAGGSPTRCHLDEAIALGVDRLEVDVCSTADGALVLRHDVALADGTPLIDIDLATLRRADRAVLTIDEAIEHLDGRVPVLFDLKTARAAQLLGVWLRRRHDIEQYAICTENLPWILHLRFAAPRAARWPTFPDLGDRRTRHVQRVLAGLWRSHTSVAGLRRGIADVQRAARELRRAPQQSLSRLGGLPWREQLPQDLAQTCSDTAAAGICVHHWVVTEQLVDEAHSLGLHVNTWTVNNPFAARIVMAAGVDSITTDRVDLVRIAVRSQPGTGANLPPARRLRAVGRTAPS